MGQPSSSCESWGAASTTCSKLSSSSSSSRSAMCPASPSFAPSVCAIVWVTSAGSRSADRPTQKTPALKAGTSSEATSSASRVLPEPPGPERVTRREPFRSRASSSSRSRVRPTKEEAGRGRFVFEIVFSGGKASLPSWKSATGSSKSFSRCSPRSRTAPSSSARVATRQQDLAPVARRLTRAARCTSRRRTLGGREPARPCAGRPGP